MTNGKKAETAGKKEWKHRSRHGHIWTGVFILLIGVAALVKATVTDLPDWLFSWQTFLIALGVFIGIKHGFQNPFLVHPYYYR